MDSSIAARSTGTTLRVRLGASLAIAVTGATVALTGVAPAHAASNVGSFTKSSVDSYNNYDGFEKLEVSLQEATTKIIDTINAAKMEILLHTDRLAASEVRTCVDAAVINVADLGAYTTDTRQGWALTTTECVTRTSSLIPVVIATGQADELGFALNAIGPIALLARAAAGLDNAALRNALIQANNMIIGRLSETTACTKHRLDGDSPPGSAFSVALNCTAYNGELGWDEVWCHCAPGRPWPAFNYTKAKDKALRNTSNTVAKAVLPILTGM